MITKKEVLRLTGKAEDSAEGRAHERQGVGQRGQAGWGRQVGKAATSSAQKAT